MVEEEIITESEKKLFLNSIRTITTQMLNELNKKSKEEF